jgi:hypothetical protein
MASNIPSGHWSKLARVLGLLFRNERERIRLQGSYTTKFIFRLDFILHCNLIHEA